MSTTDNVLLIVITVLLGLLVSASLAVMIVVFKLISGVTRVVEKAEGVVDSVESAAEVLQDAHGRLALLKLIRNIIKLVNRK